MIGNLHASPFLPQHAFFVDDERAALNPAYLSAIHVFHLHDAKDGTGHFVRIGKQVKPEILFTFEVFVRLHAIAGNSENFGSRLLELIVQRAEVEPLGSAARGRIFGVKIQDQFFAGVLGKLEWVIAGRRQFEIRYGLIQHDVTV